MYLFHFNTNMDANSHGGRPNSNKLMFLMDQSLKSHIKILPGKNAFVVQYQKAHQDCSFSLRMNDLQDVWSLIWFIGDCQNDVAYGKKKKVNNHLPHLYYQTAQSKDYGFGRYLLEQKDLKSISLTWVWQKVILNITPTFSMTNTHEFNKLFPAHDCIFHQNGIISHTS